MAEYLSPGVYVEEFDSGSKPMEGVGTSTAGFIGLAERGPIEGLPQLVTNFSDFKRKYGGYLSENEFGEYRFLAYAVEHFFINGGARCYISRVAPSDAKCASATHSIGEQGGSCADGEESGYVGQQYPCGYLPGEQGKDTGVGDRGECFRQEVRCEKWQRFPAG